MDATTLLHEGDVWKVAVGVPEKDGLNQLRKGIAKSLRAFPKGLKPSKFGEFGRHD